MKTNLIYEYTEFEKFTLTGIACHLRDYKVCWLLNSKLGIEMRRIIDLELVPASRGEIDTFPLYFCDNHTLGEQYFLLSNHGSNGRLFSQYPEADFLLFVKELARKGGAPALVKLIKEVNKVLTAFSIDFGKDHTVKAVLSDLELQLMEYQGGEDSETHVEV